MTLFWARTAQPPAVRPPLVGTNFASFHWLLLWCICYSTPTRKPVGRSRWENNDCLQFLLSRLLGGWFFFFVTGSHLLNPNIPSAKDARYTLPLPPKSGNFHIAQPEYLLTLQVVLMIFVKIKCYGIPALDNYMKLMSAERQTIIYPQGWCS